MLKRWLAKWAHWAKTLEEIDDPQGGYLLSIEARIKRLEDEVGDLRKRQSINPIPHTPST
jgi:hypothetical protein